MKLSGKIRTADGGERMTGADGATYDAARAALDGQVGEDEQLLWIRRIED